MIEQIADEPAEGDRQKPPLAVREVVVEEPDELGKVRFVQQFWFDHGRSSVGELGGGVDIDLQGSRSQTATELFGAASGLTVSFGFSTCTCLYP